MLRHVVALVLYMVLFNNTICIYAQRTQSVASATTKTSRLCTKLVNGMRMFRHITIIYCLIYSINAYINSYIQHSGSLILFASRVLFSGSANITTTTTTTATLICSGFYVLISCVMLLLCCTWAWVVVSDAKHTNPFKQLVQHATDPTLLVCEIGMVCGFLLFWICCVVYSFN